MNPHTFPSRTAAAPRVGRRDATRLLALGLAGTAAGCAHRHGANRATTGDPLQAWTQGRFPDPNGRIYFSRPAPGGLPVVVLHEVLGLEPGCFELGNRLHEQGFSVYLPLLFGEVGGHGFVSGYLRSCGSRQFTCAARDGSSAILPWIRSFCEEVSRLSGARPVGVVGMCLTGAFPLALLQSPSVIAPVLCQPTLPFSIFGAGQPTALGLTQDQVRAAVERKDVPILAMRFTKDWRCPPERFDRLYELFYGRLTAIQIPSGVDGIAEDAHSVLVGSYRDTGPTRQAFDTTVRFLRDRLGG